MPLFDTVITQPIIDVENQYENDQQTKRALNITKCFRIFAAIFFIVVIVWTISLIVRQKYIVKKPIEKIEKLYNNNNMNMNTYVKYFAKNGENPMHCKGMYCWYWQIPSKVICNIQNNAKPWEANAAWLCEAMCPDDYELDTISITCSEDPIIADNPHLGCYLVYSMKYNYFVSYVDLESLFSFILLIILCLLFLFVIISSPKSACDFLLYMSLLNMCSSSSSSSSRHYSRTWG